jgi:hypothetical protein
MDVFHLWETSPVAAPVSFGVTEAVETPEPFSRWCLDLPEDGPAAAQQLERGEAQLRASEAGLAAVPQKLDQLLKLRQSARTGSVAFATAEAPALSGPEMELWRWLDEVQGRPGPEGAPVSFAAEAAPGFDWEEAKRQCDSGIERLQQLISHAAWVETRLQGELLAQTVVSWTGDTRTVWGQGAAPPRLAWHRRSLALALASRATLLRVFFIVTQNTVKLSVLLAVPGGAVLALPVAWKFVNQVLAEVGQHQQLSNSQGE